MDLLQHLAVTVLYAVLGLIVLSIWLWLIIRFTPFQVVKEIEQDQNMALGIIIGSFVIGVSIVIAAAIQGG